MSAVTHWYHRPRAQVSLFLSPGQSGDYQPCLEDSWVEEHQAYFSPF